jgi:aldehyde dehydrogenase (NAD+)
MDRTALYVDGAWRPPGGGLADVIEASTGKPIGQAAMAAAEDIDAAVAAARRARPAWAALPGADRADLMRALARALKSRAKETAALVSRENGMPVRLSVPAEGFSPSLIIRYYADLVAGRATTELRPGVLGGSVAVSREPVGVVAAVTPWNYPQALAAMKIGPALAAGCTVVLKAPPETALDAFVYADAAEEAGLPPGVLNVLPGDRDAGAWLVAHPGVDKVAFTGSTAAGRAIAEVCGRLLRPVTLELGGKSAAVLLDDADLEAFTAKLLEVCLPNNGQTCHASTRILAPRNRYDEVLAAVAATVSALRIGDPLDPATDIGPVASSAQRGRVLELIATGTGAGTGSGRLVTGGRVPPGQPEGWYVEPTVFADVPPSARLFREEVFGPVLTVTPYDDEDRAVELANDSDYGLAGTVWTADVDRGLALTRRIESGTLGVNHYQLDLGAPFGGVKASGLGRELGPEGLSAYETDKSVYLPPVAS